ncbi:ergothioneine biosynthesis protein EgtB [Rubrivivax rivuli]|uniref:Ergothioneine biosynthesis protein EgtB n=1 Tax=Rubrivivax rivuli TaxID=1862385 RepID=A0A437RIJ5_9BURK|nr:ergothioneine biosynthesis protein EgtB [Rubrivivax rivuli]RVU46593.1 ergothioneine biosynthesis protein EgtB [Rubrivivax rivuli]
MSPQAALARRCAAIRAQTEALAAGLSEADCQAQSMADASPVKWHLAHVTWFFETFVLEAHEPGFRPHHPAYRVLFNSYYQGVGERHPRPQRGLVTRPSLAEVLAWRQAVDARMQTLLAREGLPPACLERVELGLQHEQQHQELLLTDVLHLFSCNPLLPAYAEAETPAPRAARPEPVRWVAQTGGLVDIGHAGEGFAFDNEGPRHRVYLEPHALAHRLVNNEDWLGFIGDGGYRDARWWLSAGWDWVQGQGVQAPLHWRRADSAAAGWQQFTLRGLQPLHPAAPVVHVTFYEAEAYARWAAAQCGLPLRLPTEAEWEAAAAPLAAAAVAAGSFIEGGALQPQVVVPGDGGPALQQLFGEVWQWTRSAYLPYPGYRAWAGAVGEYNGKFMLDQTVLRGGSCATPRGHIRASYRNFFPAAARWQFTGLRLACEG